MCMHPTRKNGVITSGPTIQEFPSRTLLSSTVKSRIIEQCAMKSRIPYLGKKRGGGGNRSKTKEVPTIVGWAPAEGARLYSKRKILRGGEVVHQADIPRLLTSSAK